MAFWTPTRAPSDPETYRITPTKPACVGVGDHQFYMGGVGMAAAIEALEAWAEKPLVWATIQFVNHGMLGDDLTLHLERVGGGRRLVQARAQLLRGDEVLQQTLAALGKRDADHDVQFAQMPEVPSPENCALKIDDAMKQPGNLIDQFERRIAFESADEGIERMWIKPKFEVEHGAGLLALISDFFLGAHPRTRGGVSLDNTFRLRALPSGEWILAETILSSFANGIVHGEQKQFSQDGSLLSVSSQTGLLPRRA